jgi:hypothetical protein
MSMEILATVESIPFSWSKWPKDGKSSTSSIPEEKNLVKSKFYE